MLEKSIFTWSTKLNFRGKTRKKNQASSHKFLNLSLNSEHVGHVINGTDRPQRHG